MKQIAGLLVLSFFVLIPTKSFGNNQEAEEPYNQGMKLIEDTLGGMYYMQGKRERELNQEEKATWAAAEHYLSQAIELNPNFGAAYLARSALRMSYFNFIDQRFRYVDRNLKIRDIGKDLNKAVELNPSDERAYINRGMFWKSYSDVIRHDAMYSFYDIERDFLKALKLNPKSVEALIGLGNLYAKSKYHLHKAKEHYDKALSLRSIKFNLDEIARRNMEAVEKVIEARSLFESLSHQIRHQLEERGLSSYASELLHGLRTVADSDPSPYYFSDYCKPFFKKE